MGVKLCLRFENRVLKRISGPKRDQVTGGWRKLHNEELCHLYSSTGIIRIIMSRRIRCMRHLQRIGENRTVYRLLVGQPEGWRLLGEPRRRRVDNIKMDLVETGWSGMDWIGLAQDRYKWRGPVNVLTNLWVS
jgi:hypothetical protein